jgi:hypothetical protein
MKYNTWCVQHVVRHKQTEDALRNSLRTKEQTGTQNRNKMNNTTKEQRQNWKCFFSEIRLTIQQEISFTATLQDTAATSKHQRPGEETQIPIPLCRMCICVQSLNRVREVTLVWVTCARPVRFLSEENEILLPSPSCTLWAHVELCACFFF